MKLRASHTIYSDCMRVVRNSVFLIPYIPFARVLHETPCFSYYIFRLYARRTKFSVLYHIFRLYARRTKFSVSYTIYPTACVLHETQCSSYHTALYISFRLSARRTKLRASHTIYSDCMRVVRNSVFVISYCALHFIPAVRASYEIQYFLYRIFRLPACCMKLRASHTIYSDCMRVA